MAVQDSGLGVLYIMPLYTVSKHEPPSCGDNFQQWWPVLYTMFCWKFNNFPAVKNFENLLRSDKIIFTTGWHVFFETQCK